MVDPHAAGARRLALSDLRCAICLSVSTYHLAKILAAPFLMPLSRLFMVVAVLAWTATFAGFVDSRLNADIDRFRG